MLQNSQVTLLAVGDDALEPLERLDDLEGAEAKLAHAEMDWELREAFLLSSSSINASLSVLKSN